ncbi:uncharacterized protein PRCAT00001718001 [Priceomyces carsonii]|uniref:uncharacterized protein n=1 Tax=Priceomyces carsonii TaxID=28549 RepID=UPI002EDB21C3|nr:unnamed protein product [Priceomyces carsonii]
MLIKWTFMRPDDIVAEPKSDGERDDVEAAPSGASFLILVQAFSKLGTFALNQLLLRHISPKVLGLTSYLSFLQSSILFFSREGERLAIQRTEDTISVGERHNITSLNSRGQDASAAIIQSIANFGFIPSFIGLPVASLVCYWQSQHPFHEDVHMRKCYQISLVLVFVLIGIELSSESLYAISQYHLEFKKRSKFESVSVVLRFMAICFTIFAIRWLWHESVYFEGLCVCALTFGQLVYSLSLTLCYYWDYSKEANKNFALRIKGIIKKKGSGYYYFNPNVLAIWKSIFIQLVFKQLLTEGDKLVIARLCSIEDQGVYSLVSNYGSMVARIAFLPIEETFRLSLTKLLLQRNKSNVSQSFKWLLYLCIFYVNLTVLIILGGYQNASYLLRLVLGGNSSMWLDTNVFDVLPRYVLYIPFLAFNGIFEAFFSSVASSKDIRAFSIYMSILSIFVMGLLYLLIEVYSMGLTGMIFANAINMTLRILYCSHFIKRFFSEHKIFISESKCLLRLKYSITMACIIACLQYRWLNTRSESLLDVMVSALLCLLYLSIILYSEKDTLSTTSLTLKHLSIFKKGKKD